MGGTVSYLTVFKWVGLMDLQWVACWTCCGWGSFIFNSLQMGWFDGLAVGCVLDLLWVEQGGLMDLHWIECWTCCGWGSFIFNSLQIGLV